MQREIVEAKFRPNKQEFELKSVKGGFVELRRLNHGESNELSDQRLTFHPGSDQEAGGSAAMHSKIGRHFSFSKCIISHNLGADGKIFDFAKRRDVDLLDQVVGDEIAALIDKHNETLEASGEAPKSQPS